MLTRGEIAWLDQYHARVRDLLLPRLEQAEEKQWIMEKTKPLGRSK
jgi:Xaa-Pro aminopeptidase